MDLSRVYPNLPFSIDVSQLTEKDMHHYLDILEEQFGGRYFRDRELFVEVLKDLQEEVRDSRKYLSGPYVGLSQHRNGHLKIHSHKYTANGGITIYGFDQIVAWSERAEEFLSKALEGKRREQEIGSGYQS